MKHLIGYCLMVFLLSGCGGCSGGGGGGGGSTVAAPVAPPAPIVKIDKIAGDSHANGMGVSGAMDTLYGFHWEADGIAGIGSAVLSADWPTIIDRAGKVLVFIGTNDCKLSDANGNPLTPITLAIFQVRVTWMIEQAEAAGVNLLWCNVPPDAEYMGNPLVGQTDPALVHAVNGWLASLHYDNLAVIDFHTYAADPSNPDRFNPALSSDGVHLDPSQNRGFAQYVYDHDPWR